jgi:hypothetical protein
MGGCNSHFGGNTIILSGNKNGGKQMISICTQDYQVTEMMQSPMQQQEGKRGQKSAEP